MLDSKNATYIAFHDDIDGIISAAMFLRRGIENNSAYRLYPVSSSLRGKGFLSLVDSMNLDEKDKLVILDYEFNTRVNKWFDHHYSADFGTQPVSNLIINYDPGRKSAASILADEYDCGDLPTDLISDVDMVDNAGYSSIQDIFHNQKPIMVLRAYLEKIIPHDMSYCRIVETLSRCGLNIDEALFIMKIDKSYVKMVRDEAMKAKEHLVINGDMSILRQRRPNQFPRYSELMIRPEIRYSVRLTKVDGQNVYFQVGYNRWHQQQNAINIGKSLSRIKFLNKAGGHFHVGGGIVKESDTEKLLDEFCYLFNREEPVMEKLGVDKEDPVERRASEMVKTGSEESMDDARKVVIEKKKGELETDGPSEE